MVLSIGGLEVLSNPEYKSTLDELKAYYAENFNAWKAAEKDRESHNSFSTIFDQNKSWDEKKAVIPSSLKDSVHSYASLLKKSGYKGDIHDYEAIALWDKNKHEGASESAPKKKKKGKK